MSESKEYTNLTSVEIGDHGAIVENNSYHLMNHSHHDKSLIYVDLRDGVIVYDTVCLFFALYVALCLESDASAGAVTLECKLTLAMMFAFASGIYGACQRKTWMVGIAVVPWMCLVMVMLWLGLMVFLLVVKGVSQMINSLRPWTSVWFEVTMSGVYLMLLALVCFGVVVHIRYIRVFHKTHP